MQVNLNLKIRKQPDATTCGPTSLHAVYSYYEDQVSLTQTIKEINQFDEGGGTLGVVLGKHAIEKGYDVSIISYNIGVFDPSWFDRDNAFIASNLRECIRQKTGSKKHLYTLKQYEEFLEMGGKLRFEDLSRDLLKSIIDAKVPILTGLSSTWLYREKRENPRTNVTDDIAGEPAGHFVIIEGYGEKGEFSICDPYHKNPINGSNHYWIDGVRLINSILLGISSYDGNLLLIERKK